MKNGFDLSNIDAMGVYELRSLARSFGVSSPTTKRVDQLKEEIKKIANGESEPAKASTRGRPPKKLELRPLASSSTNIPSVLVDILDKHESQNSNIFANMILRANNDLDFLNANATEGCSGYVILCSDGSKYFWKESNLFNPQRKLVFIPPSFSCYEKICEGDFVVGTCTSSQKANCMILSSLKSVNDIEFEKLSERTFLNLSEINIGGKKPFQMFSETVSTGSRYLYHEQNDNALFFEILNEIKNNTDCMNVFVGLEITPEIQNYLVLNNISNFVSCFGDSLTKSFETFARAINHCTSLAKDGKSMMIYIYDVVNIHRILNTYFSLQSENCQGYSNASQMIKKLFGLGRNLKNSHITVFAACLDEEINAQDICNDLKKACSATISKFSKDGI